MLRDRNNRLPEATVVVEMNVALRTEPLAKLPVIYFSNLVSY
jgi:hypothetical protein